MLCGKRLFWLGAAMALAGAMSSISVARAQEASPPQWKPTPFGNYVMHERALTMMKPGWTSNPGGYYGSLYVTWDPPATDPTTPQTKNAVVLFLQKVLVPTRTTAVLFVDISLVRGGQVIALNRLPVFSFERQDKAAQGQFNRQLTGMLESQQATPFFAIRPNDEILVTPRLTFTKEHKPDVVGTVGSLTQAAAALGGHGWLVATITDPARNKALSDLEQKVGGYFNSATEVAPSWRLPVAATTKDLLFQIGEAGTGANFGTLRFQVQTTCSLFKDDCGENYASVVPAASMTSKDGGAKTVESWLDEKLPRDLDEELGKNASNLRSAELSCSAMESALYGSYLGFVQSDAQYLMWRKLSGMEISAALAEAPCFTELQKAWSKMGLRALQAAGEYAYREVSLVEMRSRMKQLKYALWEGEDAPNNFTALQNINFDVAADTLRPGPWLIPNTNRQGTGVALTDVKFAKFFCEADATDHRPQLASRRYASRALAQLEGDPKLLYIEFMFDHRAPRETPPTISGIKARPADAADYAKFDGCEDRPPLSPPPIIPG